MSARPTSGAALLILSPASGRTARMFGTATEHVVATGAGSS
ncbi:hypothetical protein [Winogradskya consettensis]|nr:hypothetical protein [Actinoplanes consettensis]